MSLFKELRDLDSGSNILNKCLDPDSIREGSTEDLLGAVCEILEDDYYANYFKYRYKNGRIKLFTLNKDKAIDSCLRTKFLVIVYKLMYKREAVIPREFKQFLDPSSYVEYGWFVERGLFTHWRIDLDLEDDDMVAYMSIDHGYTFDKITEAPNTKELIDLIYHFRDLDHTKDNSKLITDKLAGVSLAEIDTSQLSQYKELCTVFEINK